MKKISAYSFMLISFLFLFVTSSCTYVSEKPEEIQLPESKKAVSPDDKEQKAYELFEEILNLTQTSDIQSVLPQMEALYLRIITEYPDIALAQECYWRLISLYVDKSIPPEYKKAENLYKEFLKKYPESSIKNLIIDTLSKSYYKNRKWDELLNLNLPVVKEYEEKGKLQNPDRMFMYAEAKFNLGDLVEAEKAYRVIIDLFPKSKRAVTSKVRLQEIEKRK